MVMKSLLKYKENFVNIVLKDIIDFVIIKKLVMVD